MYGMFTNICQNLPSHVGKYKPYQEHIWVASLGSQEILSLHPHCRPIQLLTEILVDTNYAPLLHSQPVWGTQRW